MRGRLLTALAVTGAALLVAGVTEAKQVGVTVSSPPSRLAAGERWNARLTTWVAGRPRTRPGAHPSVTIERIGPLAMPVASFHARAVGRPGRYVVSVVFPAAGRWQYVVTGVGAGEWHFAPVNVTPQR
jgi:hypothetical protein